MPTNLMLLFGSGGHSTEMLLLAQAAKLRDKIVTRDINKVICVISEDDGLIEGKIFKELATTSKTKAKLETVKLKRARKVGQSFLTTPYTFLIGLFQSLLIILKHKPNLCLTNGPAISVTISIVLKLLQVFTFGFYYKCLVIYIESFCRAKTLSLSGRLVYHLRLSNEFYVQWPDLCKKYKRAIYKGLLV